MTLELQFLVYAVVLGLAHLLGVATLFTREHGVGYAMGPRDEGRTMGGIRGARLARALRNFLETFAFFAAAVLIAQAAGAHNGRTALGAELYFWARLLYVPIYVLGVRGLRTLVWGVSVIGIVLLLWGICG